MVRKVEERVRADGFRTYVVRFRHGPSLTDPTKLRQTSESFQDRDRAELFVKLLDALGPQAALDQLFAGEQDERIPLLDEVAADHFRLLTGVERGTRENYTRLWKRSWSPHIGHLPANRVTRDEISTAINDLATRYSTKSLENQRGLLSGVLTRCVDQGYRPDNPAKRLRLPRGTEGDAVEMRIVTPDEWPVLEAAVTEHYRPLVRFLFGTGCRYGEAVALQVQDVALPNVRIRRALKWSPDGARVVGATKTKKSNRTVVVPTDLHDELRALCKGRKRTDLVFTTRRGAMIHHRSFWGRHWVPAAEQLDSPRPRIHDLRHSHASLLLARGVPIHVVQARLGHESIQTTVDTYSHLLPDAQVAAAAAADAAFSRSDPSSGVLGAGTKSASEESPQRNS